MTADVSNPLVMKILTASSTAYSFSTDSMIDDVSNELAYISFNIKSHMYNCSCHI